MRSLWSGMVTFGLVNIPVHLYAASEERELNFDFLNKKDLHPIHYARVDPSTGEEVPYRNIVRGYEFQKGEYVVLEDNDFRRASAGKTRAIEIVHFVNEKDIDIKLVEKSYYLEPAKESKQVYALLLEALKRTGKVGVGRFVLKTREHLCIIKPEGNAIVLVQLHFPGEVRSLEGLNLPANAPIAERELELATQLIKQQSRPFVPSEFKDTYTDELKEVIKNKVKGREYYPKVKEPEITGAGELLDKLRESLEYAGTVKK